MWADEWVEYCGVTVHEGYALLRSSGIPDRAAVTLEIEGAPMPIEEIALRIGSDRAVSSVRNALAADDRFMRVDRNLWALGSWELAAYQSIRQLIADEIAAHDGAVRLSKLVDVLTSRFSVSATSIMGYASSPPFSTVDGMVEQVARRPSAPRKSPFDTRRLYRVADRWVLRFNLTSEHVRGSGSPLPSALISALGLNYGEAKFLHCRHGAQRVGWSGPQAILGSVKRIVDADGLQMGDMCFATFSDDAEFDIVRIEPTERRGRARAYELAGLTLIGDSESDSSLAEAIGLAPHSALPQIAEKLRARGDYDVADSLLAVT
ncbi:hypothetical protein [Microbacterium sp. NPDC087592]|uniref:hypothetical protein n=1 Tax=Microbacterium sp. NPDC087592 TaxID=3364193 RepID=UPI0038198BE6